MSGTIAIVGGTGAEGMGLALRWARAGIAIVIGSRDAERARQAAARIRQRAGSPASIEGATNSDAARAADIVVLTIPFVSQAATVRDLKQHLRPGTIVVDTTVALAAGVGGSATRTLGVWQGSSAEQAAEILGKDFPVVAAFHHLPAGVLDGDGPVDCDVIICTNHEAARARVSELAEKIPGVRAINGGRLENSRTLEQMTALLIAINRNHKVHGAGYRVTGVRPGNS
ncbi:MAG TPA: NADPH-dependent F420 reductase [Candidatus Acidoferrales bacterium]|nr:NADPH-dependent F420 reductase [Candidatus Acidoferrales bacterium]